MHGDRTTSVINVMAAKIVVYGPSGQSERALSEAEASKIQRVLQQNGA